MHTIEQLQGEYRSGQVVAVGIIGNSKACGFRQTGWEHLVLGGPNLDADGLLTRRGQDSSDVHGWAQDLQRWLRQRNPESLIHNRSGSGWTTRSHVSKRSVTALSSESPMPVAVFVQLNVNDRLKDSVTVSAANSGIPFDEYLANTREIVRSLIAADILPILVKEDNCPMPGGAGWFYGEFDTGMAQLNTGTNDRTHRPYADYVNAYDTIAGDDEWVSALGRPVPVLDCYTPTLNTGQEPRYRYRHTDGTYDESDTGLAPADFRYSLMRGVLPRPKASIACTWFEFRYWVSRLRHRLMYGINLPATPKHNVDVWHQSDLGGSIILRVYQDFFERRS